MPTILLLRPCSCLFLFLLLLLLLHPTTPLTAAPTTTSGSLSPRRRTTTMALQFSSSSPRRRHHNPAVAAATTHFPRSLPSFKSTMYATTRPSTASTFPPERPPPPPPQSRKDSAKHFLYWFMTQKALMPELRPVSLLNMAVTGVIAYAYRQGMFVEGLDINPHTLLSGALGFFLSFRAQEGFERVEEARKIWDGVLDTSRDMARCVVGAESLLGRDKLNSRRLLDLICSYGLLLEEFACRKPRGLELESLLEERDFEVLARAHSNKPLALIEIMAEEVIHLAKTNPDFQESPYFPRMLDYMDKLSHHITKVQRLTKPPVPPVFYSHSLRFLTLYVFTLPFALVDKIPGPALVLTMGLVTWALYGLREIGIKTVYPFSAGLVDLKTLWKEVIYDARVCVANVHQEEKVLLAAKGGGSGDDNNSSSSGTAKDD